MGLLRCSLPSKERTPMAQQWFYVTHGAQHGPVSTSSLRQIAASGELQPTDLVRQEGTKEWIAADRLKGLFTAPSQKAKAPGPTPVSKPGPTAPMPPLQPMPQTSAMADQWFYTIRGERYGPASEALLKTLADRGEFKPTDLVWKEGLASWIPAQSIPRLFTRTSPTLPPLPPTTSESKGEKTIRPVSFRATAASLRQLAPHIFYWRT